MSDNLRSDIQAVTVRLAYQDPVQAVAFLEKAFGFRELIAKRLEGPNGTIIVTEVQIGDAYIMIGPAGSHGMASPASTGSSTESLMVYVKEIDAHFTRAVSNGAQIVAEPSDQYWGDRRYEAKDLEGHLWFFHEHTRDVPREEIEKIEAGFRQT